MSADSQENESAVATSSSRPTTPTATTTPSSTVITMEVASPDNSSTSLEHQPKISSDVATTTPGGGATPPSASILARMAAIWNEATGRENSEDDDISMSILNATPTTTATPANEENATTESPSLSRTSSSSEMHRIRPVTPTPSRKFSERKPKNLNLRIHRVPTTPTTPPTSRTTTTTTTTTMEERTAGRKYRRPQLAVPENFTLSPSGSADFDCEQPPNTPTTPMMPATATAESMETTATTTTTSTSTTTTIFPHEQHKTLKKLTIGFENITHFVKTGLFKRENKWILNGLYGEFRTGELSAIVGPSGAGKSTFLNILSAYTTFGYDGDVTVNGKVRDTKLFKPNVAFIRQDTSLQPFLTVKEAMHFAANLKIGADMTPNERRERVRKILEAMGMYENRHTRTGNLSGGQKKRLAIALELVNNPPVLILDEPTSGLDSSTSNQCISLLKKLAIEGRTVLCTIHQPSALTFEMFDHLYAIAEGHCIYSGATQNLVPFLAEVGLDCPESYNPADYLMEIATDDYGKQNHKLVDLIQNGRNELYRHADSTRSAQIAAMQKIDRMMAAGLMTPVTAPLFTPPLNHYYDDNGSTSSESPDWVSEREKSANAGFDTAIRYYQSYNHHLHRPLQFKPLSPINEMSSRIWDSCGNGLYGDADRKNSAAIGTSGNTKSKNQKESRKLCKSQNIYATPFYKQLSILLLRTFLILWRDSSLTTMRFVIHFATALLIGSLYYGIGNDASNAMNNFRYVFYTIMFVMYCAFSAILVKFPLEFPIVSREHFNRWYSLRAYYTAITLADIPIQLISTGLFVITTYLMTGQPLEWWRAVLFFFIVFLAALVGQSIGLAVGASLSVQLGAILGPFFICPFLAFSGFFLYERDTPLLWRWLFHVSFLKYSLDGAMLSLFGYDRPKLECHEMYCHFARPAFFLKYLDMSSANYELAVVFLLSVFLGLRIISFYIMSFRLRLFR